MPLLLIDLVKKLLWNKYALMVAIAVSLYTVGYFKGRASVHIAEVAQQIQDINKSEVIEQKVEANHDKRIRKILSDPVDDAATSRMLSTWPDQAPPTPQAGTDDRQG